MKILVVLYALLASTVTFAANPIVTDIFTADPAVHYFEGKYWVYTTHDEPSADSYFIMKDWRAYSSSDLIEWQDQGVIMSLDDIDWADDFAFAPDVVFRDGTYYMYFPVNGLDIGVATSTSPAGPFKDAIGAPLITSNPDKPQHMADAPHHTIDPAVFIDDDGQAYMYFGNDGPGIILEAYAEGDFRYPFPRNTPRVVKLKDNMLELDSEVISLDGIDNFFEASWMHKYNDTYYLSYASGFPFSTIAYATSDHPLGPFTKQGIIVDELTWPWSTTNHHSTVEKDGQWYFFYHTTELSGGQNFKRSFAVDKMQHNPDGTIEKVQRTFMGVDDKLKVNSGEVGAGYAHSFTDTNGQTHTWHRDRNYDDWDNTFSTQDDIANTANDSIYQVQRYSEGTWWSQLPLKYFFKVENADYEIKLHFAETYFHQVNKRKFDVVAEGERYFTNLDIFQETGHDAALVKTFVVNVSDGELNIDLLPVKNNPTLAGIEIKRIY